MSARLDPLSYLAALPESQQRDGWPRIAADAQHPRTLVSLASNNYLGLSRHPAVVAAARDAIDEFGVGSGASRNGAEHSELFLRLEAALASFKGFDSALVFQSGYATNIGVLPALAGEGDVIAHDEHNHASCVDGIRLSGADREPYAHRDVNHLETILRRVRHRRSGVRRNLFVATDGVFGMDGDIAPLGDICDLAERFGATMIVDDAHATGVLGRGGRGSVDHLGVGGRVDVQIGTLSKALGGLGGYAGGRRYLRDHLIATARPMLYSSLPPQALAAASIAALQVMEAEPDLIGRLWRNTKILKASLDRSGFDTGNSQTPIIPIYLPSPDATNAFASLLRASGVVVQAITDPRNPNHRPRLRLIVTSELTEPQLQLCAEVLDKVGRRLQVLPPDAPGRASQ